MASRISMISRISTISMISRISRISRISGISRISSISCAHILYYFYEHIIKGNARTIVQRVSLRIRQGCLDVIVSNVLRHIEYMQYTHRKYIMFALFSVRVCTDNAIEIKLLHRYNSSKAPRAARSKS